MSVIAPADSMPSAFDAFDVSVDVSAVSDFSALRASSRIDRVLGLEAGADSTRARGSLWLRRAFARGLVECSGIRLPVGTSCIALLLMSACGIAPVTSKAAPPPTVAYINPHGRPRAFGGGVCPVSGRHEHTYQPVPAAFYVDVAGAWHDTRPIRSFTGPHPWRGRRCSISRYHQHAIATGDLAQPSSGKPGSEP